MGGKVGGLQRLNDMPLEIVSEVRLPNSVRNLITRLKSHFSFPVDLHPP